MPELPEVEVLVRHLAPRLSEKTIRSVRIIDRRSLRHPAPAKFIQTMRGARFQSLERRGKYLVFSMRKNRCDQQLIAHLGMTGRLYLSRPRAPLPKHATVRFGLGSNSLVFEDPRRFGGLTLDGSALARLGPEPLGSDFTIEALSAALAGSDQPIKVRLLDQSVVAGIGNIYASEALFLARIHPKTPSRKLHQIKLRRLRTAIRRVLSQAIQFGSTVPLHFDSSAASNGLFYHGQSPEDSGRYEERLRVYGREGAPCRCCGSPIRRIVLAGRSTFLCPRCQR